MRATFVVLLALSAAGCNIFGPSRSVDGEWIGSLGKFSYVCLTLSQDGDTITGTASASSDSFLLYRGVPVSGEHPDVHFTVGPANVEACCQHLVGLTFSGKQDSTDDIVGTYGTGDIRFKLDDRNLCATARTVP
jgi:hypothetical protein